MNANIWFVLLVAFLTTIGCEPAKNEVDQGIRPYGDNPFYWQYEGRPVLLFGGSVEDNLFQRDDLADQLDLLRQAGGNYVRNTMSSRDAGNVWPHVKNEAGFYDLSEVNPAYWNRFNGFLEMTAARDIIVQIEVWATFDYYDDRDMRRGFWQQNPWNPRNNTNYTVASSGLPDTVASHPTQTENPFFFTVPAQENNELLLSFQQAFVDRLLSYTLQFDHILYCIDNETSVPATWGGYWASYIKQKAREGGKDVFVTEMWDPWDLAHEMHNHTFDHPEIYDFVDVSQNNHNSGQEHWDNAQKQRERIRSSGVIRPMNNVKIYGAEESRFGSAIDGQERFWRNIFGGMASARFHRPPSGLGLDSTAQAHLKSAQRFLGEFDVFRAHPTIDIIQDREANEAYGMEIAGSRRAIFFPNRGSVSLDMKVEQGAVVKWLELSSADWVSLTMESAPVLTLTTPMAGMWVAVVDM